MVVVGGSEYACQDVATRVYYVWDVNVMDGPAVVACGPGRYVGAVAGAGVIGVGCMWTMWGCRSHRD